MSARASFTEDDVVRLDNTGAPYEKGAARSIQASQDALSAQAAYLLRKYGFGIRLDGVRSTASLASASDPTSTVGSTPELMSSTSDTTSVYSPFPPGTPTNGATGYFDFNHRDTGSGSVTPSLRDLYLDNLRASRAIRAEDSKPASRTASIRTHGSDRSNFCSISLPEGISIPESEDAVAKPQATFSASAREDGGETLESLRLNSRSASFSTFNRPPPFALQRSPSLLSLPTVFGPQNYSRPLDRVLLKPTRNLILPNSNPSTLPQNAEDRVTPADTAEALAEASTETSLGGSEEEPTAKEKKPTSKPSIFQRANDTLIKIYAPRDPPPLILPTAPDDTEKVSYLKTNRLGLYSFGVFSFLSLSAGMWLFVVSALPFYWFGAVVVLLQTYLVISYIVSIVGKDFDYESHKKILEEHPITEETAPTVDIYLPCCKEPIEVLENTYKHIQKLEWPASKLKVYVLDDGASEAVQALAKQYGFEYICREDRPRLKKAGNLRWAFARTTGDFFTIYDADFCPRHDFLMEVVPQHLAHPKTAIIQTPQYFRTLEEQTWVEQGAGSVQELFYRVIQVNRNRWGASICVGSNAVYRREALKEVGGTAEIGFSEDVHTGFYALTRGWELRYVPLCLACGICPDTPRAFFSQQMRWCMGSTTLLTNPDFWRSSLNPIQKICYLSGMMYYSAISLSIFLNPMPGILMIWVRPDYVRFYNLAFAVPSLIYSFIAIRCWAKSSYGMNVQFIMVIQTYAYCTAIKDRLFGRALAWVPSGDTKAHKNNKYRNMRILAWCWMTTVMVALVSGVIFQVLRGLRWYDCLPVLLLDTFNIFIAHRFLFCHGKL